MLVRSTGQKMAGYAKWLSKRPELRSQPIDFLTRLAKWKLLSALRHEVAIDFDGDLTIRSPSRNITASGICLFGYPEPALFRFLSGYLRNGMTFCDVGANVGAYTLFAAKRVGRDGHVFAFEPIPELYRFLEGNVARNGFANVTTAIFAVGARRQAVAMRYIAGDVGKSHILATPDHAHDARPTEMIDLDSYISDNRRIDYLKIDVEGYELQVLSGARRILQDNPNIVVQTEILPYTEQRYGYEPQQVCEFLWKLGFVSYSAELNGSTKVLQQKGTPIVGDVLWCRTSCRPS